MPWRLQLQAPLLSSAGIRTVDAILLSLGVEVLSFEYLLGRRSAKRRECALMAVDQALLSVFRHLKQSQRQNRSDNVGR